MDMLRAQYSRDSPHDKSKLLYILFWCLIIFAAWCAWNITYLDMENAEDAGRTEHFRAVAGISAACESAEAGRDKTAAAPSGEQLIDISAVIDEAPETCAWISIPGTDIEYPVMQGPDNEFYLTHAPDGAASRQGSIFMSWENTKDFSDPNTVLYGHRMNTGAMFAQLERYRDWSFLEEYPYIFITVPDGNVYAYEICSVQEIEADGTAPEYRTVFSGNEELAVWHSRPRSGVICAREVRPSDRYLTLSTCVKGKPEARLIVLAACITEVNRKETV